jgi:hypothetical protein
MSELNEEKKAIVRKLGFGPLLDFSCSSNVNDIFLWLVNQFDTKTNTITLENGFSFTLTTAFVYHVIGIPCGPEPVIMTSSHDDRHFINEMLKNQAPTVECVCNMLKNDLDEATFARTYLILALNAFIAPSPCGSISDIYYHNLLNIQGVHSLDWCSFALRWLVMSIKSYQSRKLEGFEDEIGGCKLILVVSIFSAHHVAI